MQHLVEKFDVGVIVGRFQVHELHAAHRAFINKVCDEHSKVVIFLGLSPLMLTKSNPLDFESRKQMILDEFPDVTVLYQKDVPDDRVWSKRLDGQVADLLTPSQTAVLYGGRDGFLAHYQGMFATRELVSENVLSGTAVRKKITSGSARANPDFRAGVVWASAAKYPTAYCTVDVAILDKPEGLTEKMLLGRKPNERLFRFIGGFSDPRSPNLEADCRREVQEEANIAITDPQYVGSTLIDDWRYRNEDDKIKTTLFLASYFSGRPEPGDDIEEVRWFDLDTLNHGDLVAEHRPLIEMLFERLGR